MMLINSGRNTTVCLDRFDQVSTVTARVQILKRFHVRFGSEADIQAPRSDVRFTPKSGH